MIKGTISFFLIILALILGCQNTGEHMNEQHKKAIENYIQSYNSFDIDGMIKDLDDEVVFENIANGEVDLRVEGIAGFKEQAESAKQYFTQRQQTITSWEMDGDMVGIEIDYEAILAVDLPNGMKAGDTLKLKGQSEFVFEGDKIVAIRDRS